MLENKSLKVPDFLVMSYEPCESLNDEAVAAVGLTVFAGEVTEGQGPYVGDVHVRVHHCLP